MKIEDFERLKEIERQIDYATQAIENLKSIGGYYDIVEKLKTFKALQKLEFERLLNE